jgi:hypothetical protein
MKKWPKFNKNGDLPRGIHKASLSIEHWQIKRNGKKRGIVEVLNDDT